MKTSLRLLVPLVLFVGLVAGALLFRGIVPSDKPCALGECPLALHQSDSGKTFFYGITTRFTVFLDERDNPSSHLRCIPEGVVAAVSNAPAAVPPAYAARFEGLAPGTCVLNNDNFSVSVTIQ